MDVLPRWERIFYWIAGLLTFAYSQWAFFQACQEFKPRMKFVEGWKLLGIKRDAIDYEWACFQSCVHVIISLTVGHLVLSHILIRLQLSERILKICIFGYDTAALAYILGTKVTLLFLCELVLMYIASLQNFVSIVWVLGLILTSSLNFDWVEQWQVFEHWHTAYDKQLFFISNAYLQIRSMSAAIEIIKQKKLTQGNTIISHDKKNNKLHTNQWSMKKDIKSQSHLTKETNEPPSPLDFMLYNMYFPMAIYGPIVTFDDFHPQFKAFCCSKGQSAIFGWKNVIKSVLRILFWWFFIELTAHFMYPNSLSLYSHFISKLSIAGMIGFIVWQSLYFTMKYICIFAIGSLACKIEDLTPPSPPRCAATLYRFTDIWKYFDVGYYNFIKKYIYIPLGGSQNGFFWQSLASITAFAFIFYWHGATYDIFLWAAGNWSVIALEMIAIQLLKSTSGSRLKNSLSPAARLRIKALLYVPCYVVSSIQIVCFFFSKHIAYIMADIMILSASWQEIFVQTACFYFNFQNAMYITDYLSARKLKQH